MSRNVIRKPINEEEDGQNHLLFIIFEGWHRGEKTQLSQNQHTLSQNEGQLSLRAKKWVKTRPN